MSLHIKKLFDRQAEHKEAEMVVQGVEAQVVWV